MPRCAREISLTGYYHVFDRGNSKQIIFEDDSDRYRFLSDISDRFACHDVAVLAWCLMDNHFHLMVDDPYDNLSKAMQCALTAYAKYFNGKTGRTGHLFDNRYSRVAVESDTQAVQLLDYIHLNPVKGALDSLEAYRWSSYKAYQLGYDPFDICDAAPMLDVVGEIVPMQPLKLPSSFKDTNTPALFLISSGLKLSGLLITFRFIT